MWTALPLFSSRFDVQFEVADALSGGRWANLQLLYVEDDTAAKEHLDFELPDLLLLDFSDPAIQAFALVAHIENDPWLLSGGIIAICDDTATEKKINALQGLNVVYCIRSKRIGAELAHLLGIVYRNKRLISHLGLGADIVSRISASYELSNDLLEARCYANMISNFLYNAGACDGRQKGELRLALTELLLNGIEHGNCEISFEDKSAWLEAGKDIGDLVEERNAQPKIAARRVRLDYSVRPDTLHFSITDAGAGFDWKAQLERAEEPEIMFLEHGRGIAMTRGCTQNLSFNAIGNQVSFDLERMRGNSRLPALFRSGAVREVVEGEIIVRTGDVSDCIFFIITGRYNIVRQGHVIGRLSPEDIFIGEMSFVLNARRSADVIAACDGKLMEIPRRDFMISLKSNPRYSLLLAKLLAARLARTEGLPDPVEGPTG